MDAGTVETLVNLGGLGVAVAVLVLFGREMFRRMNDASRWTEQLAEKAIQSMQEISRESISSQRQVAEALTQLCGEMQEMRRDRSVEHREILEACRSLGGSLRRRGRSDEVGG